MPQNTTGDSTNQSLADTSWSKATSDSTQESVARARGEAGRLGGAAMGSLKEGARSLGDEAKDRASRYVEGGKETVTEHLDAFAEAVKRASDELRDKDETMAANLVRQAASGLESLSRSVSGANLGDMVQSVRSFGRSNPTAFIGGAVLAGLALGRFARASAHHDDDWRRGGSDWDREGPPYGGGRYGGGESYASGQSGSGRYGDAQYGQSYASGRSSGADSSYAAGQYGGGQRSGGGSGQESSAYRPSERSSFTPGSQGGSAAPSTSQGYAGGGMGTDPIQSPGQSSSQGSGQSSSASGLSSGTSSGPSSETDSSVTTSSHSGGSAQPGSISTGDKS